VPVYSFIHSLIYLLAGAKNWWWLER